MEIDLPWYQPNPSEVARWEFQASNGLRWVDVPANPIGPCPACFQAIIEVPEYTSMVRSRSIGNNGVASEWSEPLALPEPDGLMLGLIFLAILRHVWHRSHKTDKHRLAPNRAQSHDATRPDANANV